MKKSLLIIAFALALTGLATAFAAPPAADRGNVNPLVLERARAYGTERLDLIVTFDSPPAGLERAAVANLGGQVKRSFRSIPAVSISLPAPAVERLARRAGVRWVTLDLPVQLHKNKSDGGSNRPPENGGDNQTVFCGENVTIAMIDSGIQSTHPDLAGRVVMETNFVLGSSATTDKWGHGTHVAGIMVGTGAASGGNYVGVSPCAKLYSARVLEKDGSGLTSDVIAGIDDVISNRNIYDIRVVPRQNPIRVEREGFAPPGSYRESGPVSSLTAPPDASILSRCSVESPPSSVGSDVSQRRGPAC